MPSAKQLLAKYREHQDINQKKETKDQETGPAFLRYAPIRKPAPKTPPASKRATEPFRVAVLPDVHVPRQDKKAWATALALIADFKPHGLVIIGDFADFESISHHPKNRPDLTKFASEYHEANLALDALQLAAGSAQTFYVEGNHEYRAVKYVNAFPHLDGLLSVPENLYILAPGTHVAMPLGLASPRRAPNKRVHVDLRGITWIPFRYHLRRAWKSPWGCGYMHSAKGNSSWGSGGANHAAYHANNVCPVSGCNIVVYGHHHTFQHSRTPAGNEAYCAGFLGDFDADEPAFDYAAGPSPWVTGMLFQEFQGDLHRTEEVYIKNGKALFRNRIFG